MLPNFLIVGAPKAATTSLYHYLSEHPEVFMSEPKEVNFFSADEINAQGLYYSDFKCATLEEYQSLFRHKGNAKAVGEGSVSYLFYPQTPIKIHALIPDTKIIILLRNPVERGFSHYLMDYRLGLVDLSYEEIVFQKVQHPHMKLYYQQYVELGLYFEQVKRYLDLFGQHQVKIYFQEDLRDNPTNIINDLYHFLDLSSAALPNIEKEHNSFSMPKNKLIHTLYRSPKVRKVASALLPESLKSFVSTLFFERKQKPQLSNDLRQELIKLYKDDIIKLETLINKDLTKWYGVKE